ncbi:MAG: AlkZ-related protein, partial [Blastocatellia bacterium]
AQAVLKVLRKEWEMASADLRATSGVRDRKRFTKAMDDLQRAMKVIPGDVLYEPAFTYIWTLPEARFPEQMAVKLAREQALRDVAKAFLGAAGLTLCGELARVTGLSRRDAGLGNHQLVAENLAERIGEGVYRWSGRR